MHESRNVANESFSYETANQALAAGEADAVAFGKLFVANPDLPKRFALGAPLNTPDPSTFYGTGPQGYTDYPALDDHAATPDAERRAVA
jgi:2,4-dienoyl-CoA reductase-like NADH-dependent reductase (Old Yellow Enzyme family)